MTSLSIVTVSTGKPEQPYYCYDEFFASCRRFGFEPLILSEGFGGLGTKPKMLLQAIRDGLIQSENVIFVDCFDVVCQRNPSEIPDDIHRQFDCNLIWGAEKNCFPRAELAERHPVSDTPYRFLNSGMALGRTVDFADFLESINADEIPADFSSGGQWTHFNDQEIIMEKIVENDGNSALDTGCKLFQNLHGVEKNELSFESDGTIKNVLTGTKPFFLHFNGGAKTGGLREPILEHLQL